MRGSYQTRVFLAGLFFISVLLISNSCRRESFSPSQADSFIKFYSLSNKDEGFVVKTLAGRGYVVAGTTYTEASSNIILLMTDEYGKETGTPKQFGGEYDDRAHSMIILSDGGFAILGSTTIESEEDESLIKDMYLVRTDRQGNELWSRNYGRSNKNEAGYSLIETSDGGFILIGSTETPTDPTEDPLTGVKNVYLVKTDSAGEVMWTRTHGGLNDDVGLSIAERFTDEGVLEGYIYTGYTRSYSQPGQSNSNIFIVQTNPSGIATSFHTYGSTGDDFGESILPHPEGGFVLLGTTSNPSSGVKNVFLGRIDDISNPLWTTSLGGSDSHVAACIKITPEGNYIISGTLEITSDNHVIFLMKTDSNGNILFNNTFGGSGQQRGQAVDLADDGGFIITGSNKSGNNSMITLIKTNPDGEL